MVLITVQVVDPIDNVQITTGERSGTLVETLLRLAEEYRERFQRGLVRLITAIRWTIILVTFIWVGISTYKNLSATKSKMNEVYKILEKEMKTNFRSIEELDGAKDPTRPRYDGP
jgi:hypothetical protein